MHVGWHWYGYASDPAPPTTSDQPPTAVITLDPHPTDAGVFIMSFT